MAPVKFLYLVQYVVVLVITNCSLREFREDFSGSLGGSWDIFKNLHFGNFS
jgi:hypothetical protein